MRSTRKAARALGIAGAAGFVISALTLGPPRLEAQQRSEFVPTFSTNSRVKQQMERLQRLAQQKLWDEWVAAYQQLVDDPRDLVLQRDEEFLVGVRFTCHQQLAALPVAVRQRYRALVDNDAKKLFEKAQSTSDAVVMREVYSRYRFSSYGGRALQWIANRALDEGRAELARIAYSRLVKEPGTSPTLLLRYALAASAAGKATEAKTALDRVRKEFGQQQVQLSGQSIPAAQAADQIASAQKSVEANTEQQWERFGGTEGGRLMSQPFSAAGAPVLKKQWAFVLPTVLPAVGGRPNGYGASVRSRFSFLTFPALSKDRLIVQGPRGLTALDLKSGETAWDAQDFALKSDEVGGDVPNAQMRSYYNTPRSVQAAPALDGYVAVTRTPLSNGNDTSRWPMNFGIAAYDVRKGRQLWRRIAGGEPRGVYFNLPSVESNTAFTGIATYRGGITEYSATALDAGTGETLWTTYLGAGSDPLSTIDGSPPAVRDGLVWIESALYTLNALDVITGEIRYIYRYDPGKRSIFRAGFDSAPVVANEPISLVGTNGTLVFCPRWGTDCVGIDPANGKLLWSSPKAPGQSVLGALFAVDGKRAYIGGGALQAINLADGAREWSWEPEASSSSIGFPVLCGDRIYVVVEQKLWIRNAADGKEVGVVDLASHLGENAGYTSLLALKDRLVLCTRDRLFVFAPQ